MDIYIDESGSINNYSTNNDYFVICLIVVKDAKKLERVFKRFVSKNITNLKKLDNKKGSKRRRGKKSKMFLDNSFKELKGSKLDMKTKKDLVKFFSQKEHFNILYIKIHNYQLDNRFMEFKSKTFNLCIRFAIEQFIRDKYLTEPQFFLHLDQRNEKKTSINFLENYLNTEIYLREKLNTKFTVEYLDSKLNTFIQIADVFSNLLYSHIKTNKYEEEFFLLKQAGIFKGIYDFPN